MRYDKKVLKKAVVAMTAIVLSVSNPFQAGTTGTMGMARHETARTDLDAKHLFQAHLDAIVGVYHDDADPLPDGGRYIWSERIPDIVMNYAVDIDWTNPNTIRDAAARRGRAPAVLRLAFDVADGVAFGP